MFPHPRFHGSQPRRPWSPEVLSSGNADSEANARQDYLHPSQGHQLPEPSASVEALDLTDYARTLAASRFEGPYPPFPDSPPSPSSHHILASPSVRPAPSLTSRATLSSNGHSSSSRHHPFSVPTSQRPSLGSHRTNFPAAEPRIQSNEPEVDIGGFPPWSQGWYTPRISGSTPSSIPDLDHPPPASHLNKKAPFDPAYVPGYSDPFTPTPHGYFPASSLGNGSEREVLPWGDDSPNSVKPLHPAVKEERIRMLEREFGQKASSRVGSDDDPFVDENGKPLIGTVDKNGYLVTAGPKKRMATRALQVILASAAAIPSIYAAAFIKNKLPPPPANKPPAFVLYGFSVVTLLSLLYLFLFRSCCCMGKRRPAAQNPLSSGMMVLPVQSLPGGKKGGKKSGKDGKGNPANDIQVNLIVDPDTLKGGRREDSDEDDDEWEGSTVSGRRKRRPRRRRGIFAGLAMEEEWKQARGFLKKVVIFDAISLLIWGAVFIYLMIGKRCPIGDFNGWCNAYNVSSAAACLLCFSFGLSIFFDVKDLASSKVSPRTRF